jgi:hypothetical protein
MTNLHPLHQWAIDHIKPEPGPVVAKYRGWVLHAKGSKGGWHSFVLVAPATEQRKRKYWGGYNGDRLARSRDMGILFKYNPDVGDWLAAYGAPALTGFAIATERA